MQTHRNNAKQNPAEGVDVSDQRQTEKHASSNHLSKKDSGVTTNANKRVDRSRRFDFIGVAG